MDYFITNHSNRVIDKDKSNAIKYHLYRDCKDLNADYEKKEEFHLNSGISSLSYENEDELIRHLLIKKIIATRCLGCEQKYLASVHDEFTK
ncbi:MAG: hypothetical protein IPP77_12100 [Bacteroidetes bacterium]|nr:hypothetical protein [Bacteroidota bacterium]